MTKKEFDELNEGIATEAILKEIILFEIRNSKTYKEALKGYANEEEYERSGEFIRHLTDIIKDIEL